MVLFSKRCLVTAVHRQKFGRYSAADKNHGYQINLMKPYESAVLTLQIAIAFTSPEKLDFRDSRCHLARLPAFECHFLTFDRIFCFYQKSSSEDHDFNLRLRQEKAGERNAGRNVERNDAELMLMDHPKFYRVLWLRSHHRMR